MLRLHAIREVASEGVVGEDAEAVGGTERGKIFEGAEKFVPDAKQINEMRSNRQLRKASDVEKNLDTVNISEIKP